MAYTFDGPNKLIVLTPGTVAFTAIDLYSRWKDWLQLSDNSKFLHAFTTVGGDPIGAGQAVAPYIFLNTVDGWKIRPHEADHELRIEGNLYSLDPVQGMFVPTLGNFTVVTVIERSASAIAVSSGSGLSTAQANQLLDLWRLSGLDGTAPLVVTATQRTAGAGVQQTISEAPPGTVTVTRT